ncbi:MAG: hypothetical protein ACRDNF_13410 [Streptosporangiaceae bacterium]
MLADPNVAGGYTALTAFGLVPAALAGADVSQVLAAATTDASFTGAVSTEGMG